MFFRKKSTIKEGEFYTIPGELITFKLEGLDYNFDEFQVCAGDDFLIKVENEIAMNIARLSEAIRGMEDIEIQPESDTLVDFTIKLSDYLYHQLEPMMMDAETAEDLFNISHEGSTILTDLDNYVLVKYTMKPQI